MAVIPPGNSAIPLTITFAFNSAVKFDNILSRISIKLQCLNCLIVDEGITTAKEKVETRPRDLKTSLENINKFF